jgi:hypothetical protein
MKDIKSKIILLLLNPFVEFFGAHGIDEITIIGIPALVCLILLIRRENKKRKKDPVFIVILAAGMLLTLVAILKFQFS